MLIQTREKVRKPNLDPAHNEEDIRQVLAQKCFGEFYVYVTWWSDKEIPVTRLVKFKMS